MSETKVKTGKVRFSYVHVFKAHAHKEGDDPKFSVSIIIPKKDKATIAKINEAVEVAIKEGISKFSPKIQKLIQEGRPLPASFKMPLRDGDEEKEDNEEYADAMFIGCTSKRKPGIVDGSLDDLYDETEFYSGCYGRASVNFYAFNVKNQGIACGLNNLQKLEDGENLGGSAVSAADDFGDDDGLL